MLKKVILAGALVAGTAFAQQNTDISGANFQSGQADATLAALGRKAAASGSRLIVTAPADWHAKIASKIHAGGDADIVLKDGFYENVLVRVDDKAAAQAEAEKESARVEAEKKVAKAEAERKAREETARQASMAAAAAAAVEPKPVPVPSGSPIAPSPSMAMPAPAAVAVAPAPKAAPAAAVAVKPVVDTDAIRERLSQSLNNGRAAAGDLQVASLQAGDMIYVDGPVRAVVRREGLKPVLYWLADDLDLRRSELKVVGDNRYQVVTQIRGEGSLRREFDAASTLALREPAEDAASRSKLEHDFNDGRRIGESLSTEKLRNGDVIYTNTDSAVVVRRSGNTLNRYWLSGSLDLRQAGLQADGANKYKVLNDNVR